MRHAEPACVDDLLLLLDGPIGVAQLSEMARTTVFRPENECFATAGDVGAMVNLGFHYTFESARLEHAEAGCRWLEEAAAAGSLVATTLLGLARLHGLGCNPDALRAMTCFQRATAAQERWAPLHFAHVLLVGRAEITPDPNQAIPLLSHASKDLPAAEHLLGECYLAGVGVRSDIGSAAWHFLSAANRGFEPSLLMLDALTARFYEMHSAD